MKMECDVIRDLLPLYAEKIASPATNALVEQHLAECPDCRAQLEQMEQPLPVQPELQPEAPLENIRRTLRKKSIRTAAAAVLTALCAVGLVFWMGNLSTPVTAEEAGIWLYNKKEDGANLCVLEVQGENVRLELEGSFNWGKPSITVRAVRYAFPGIHKALEGLLGAGASDTSIAVSGTQLLTVECADETRHYRDGQQVQRYILKEADGTQTVVYAPEGDYTLENGVVEKG